MMRQILPIGIQTLREIRERDCYYVDKTAFALRLIEQGKYYFLSRLEGLAARSDATMENVGRLYDLLLANDFAGLERLFAAFFAGIPSDWYRNNPIARYEGYYASVFYAYFASLGLDIVPEESSNAGRLDMAVRFNHQVYLFEFKVVEREPEGGALRQIKARGYADKYRAAGCPLHLIGVEFSRERRTVVGFEVQTWG